MHVQEDPGITFALGCISVYLWYKRKMIYVVPGVRLRALNVVSCTSDIECYGGSELFWQARSRLDRLRQLRSGVTVQALHELETAYEERRCGRASRELTRRARGRLLQTTKVLKLRWMLGS